jgi:hypothetical protein
MKARLLALALAATCCAASTAVHAQSEDAGAQTVIRRGLIEAAQTALDRGDFARCIETGQRAAAIRDSGSLRKLIAQCQLSSRDYVAALGSAEVCIALLRRDTAALQRQQLLTACEQINADAQAHTGRLTVVTPTPAPDGLRVRVGSADLPAVTWGVPAIVNAEVALDVRADAPGFVAFVSSVTVSPRGSAEIRVVLSREPAATVAVAPVPAPRVTPPRADVAPPLPRADATPPRRAARASTSPLLVAGAVVGGVGAVTAVIGFAAAGASFADFQGSCATPSTLSLYDQCAARMSSTQGTIDATQAIGFAGLGLALIGGGLAVYGATRPNAERAAVARWGVAPFASRAASGAVISATW